MKLALAFKILIKNPRLFGLKFKSFFSKLFRPFSIGTQNVVQSFGSIHYHFDPALLEKSIRYRDGSIEPELAACLQKYLKPGDIFIDVGANIGYFSAMALSLVGAQGQVHAFEPVKKYGASLERLKKDHPGCPLFVNSVALGSRAEEKMIYLSKKEIGWNTFIKADMPESQIESQEMVQVIRFDDYAREKQLRRIRLIKIDVEGFEPEVLKGMQNVLKEQRPVVYCEVSKHLYSALSYSVKELLSMMKSLGYESFDAHDIGSMKRLDQYDEDQCEVLFLPLS